MRTYANASRTRPCTRAGAHHDMYAMQAYTKNEMRAHVVLELKLAEAVVSCRTRLLRFCMWCTHHWGVGNNYPRTPNSSKQATGTIHTHGGRR